MTHEDIRASVHDCRARVNEKSPVASEQPSNDVFEHRITVGPHGTVRHERSFGQCARSKHGIERETPDIGPEVDSAPKNNLLAPISSTSKIPRTTRGRRHLTGRPIERRDATAEL